MKIGFIAKGRTFLKTMLPLVYYAEKYGIEPILYVCDNRPGKEYDVINSDDKHKLLSLLEMTIEFVEYTDDNHIIADAKKRGVVGLVGQDTTHHHRGLTPDRGIPVFSIGYFVDTLHNLYDIKKGTTPRSRPTRLYLPSFSIAAKAKELYPEVEEYSATLGHPIQDHALFSDARLDEGQPVVTVFTGRLDTYNLEDPVQLFEDLADFCYTNYIGLHIKDRVKTNWAKGKANRVLKKANHILVDEPFPSSSTELILSSDIVIAGYSTVLIEAGYLGVPSINLPISTGYDHGNRLVNVFDFPSLVEGVKPVACSTRDEILDEVEKATDSPRTVDLEDRLPVSVKILADIHRIIT
jgi:hypothetical protein